MNFNHTEEVYREYLDDIVHDLTGYKWDSLVGDDSGVYWSRGHWVGGDDICNALRQAFDAGVLVK